MNLAIGDRVTVHGETFTVVKVNKTSVRVSGGDRPDWTGSYSLSHLRAHGATVTRGA